MLSSFWRKRGAWFLVGLTVLLVLVVRFRLRNMPLERDEGEYAYAGQLILQGVPPYKFAYNMKLPGTYGAYALIMAIFGQTPAGIHIGLALVNAASVVLVFLLGRKLLDELTGAVAAFVFAVLSITPLSLGLAAHATHFVMLPALFGMLLLLKGTEKQNLLVQVTHASGLPTAEPGRPTQLSPDAASSLRHPAGEGRGEGNFGVPSIVNLQRTAPAVFSSKTLFISGLLFGLAFVMKQHGVFFGLFGLFYLLWLVLAPRLLPENEDEVEARRAELAFRAKKKLRELKPGNRPQVPKQGSSLRTSPSPMPARQSIFAAARASVSRGEGLPTGAALEAKQEFPSPQPSPLPKGRGSSEGSPGENASKGAAETQTGSQQSSLSREATEDRHLEDIVPTGAAGGKDGVLGVPNSPAPKQGSSPNRTRNAKPTLFTLLRSHAPTLLLFCAGLVLPYALTCLVLWLAGVFPQFIFWTVSYASKYAAGTPLAEAPGLFVTMFGMVLGPNVALWLLGFAGALLIWWDLRLIARQRFFLAALLLCSVGSISIGLYFREHYFIMLLPIIAILAGIAVSRALLLLKWDQSIELFLALSILLLFAIGVIADFVGNGAVWFTLSPEQAYERIYATTVFADANQAADYIRTHSAPDAKVAVVGSEPEIYFYSHRRSATGYIYTYPLMEAQPYAARMQAEMIDEIERAKPEYVVYVNNRLSWLPHPGFDPGILQWWERYWATNLDLVTTINTRQGPDLRNELRAGEAQGEPGNFILLLKRRRSTTPR